MSKNIPWFKLKQPNARKGAISYAENISKALSQASNSLHWSHDKNWYLVTEAKLKFVNKLMHYANRARFGK